MSVTELLRTCPACKGSGKKSIPRVGGGYNDCFICGGERKVTARFAADFKRVQDSMEVSRG